MKVLFIVGCNMGNGVITEHHIDSFIHGPNYIIITRLQFINLLRIMWLMAEVDWLRLFEVHGVTENAPRRLLVVYSGCRSGHHSGHRGCGNWGVCLSVPAACIVGAA